MTDPQPATLTAPTHLLLSDKVDGTELGELVVAPLLELGVRRIGGAVGARLDRLDTVGAVGEASVVDVVDSVGGAVARA